MDELIGIIPTGGQGTAWLLYKVFRNVGPVRNWVGFILRAPLTLGTTVRVEACGKAQTQQLYARTGWLHQSSRDVHFGLGNCTGPVDVSIRWPDGAMLSDQYAANAYHVVSRR